MKKLILMILVLIVSSNLFADDKDNPVEIYLMNGSYFQNVEVKIFPVSAVINGDDEMNLLAKLQMDQSSCPNKYNYINGVYLLNGYKQTSINLPPITNSAMHFAGYNYDCYLLGGAPCSSQGVFGRGIYKIIFNWADTDNIPQLDSVLIEQDAGANYDTRIIFVDDLSEYGGPPIPGLVYRVWNISGWGGTHPVSLTNRYIKMWDQYPWLPEANRRPKEFGSYTYSGGNTIENPYNKFPIYSTTDCNLPNYLEQNHVTDEPYSRDGKITLNLTFTKKIVTPLSFPLFNGNRNVALSVEPLVTLTIDKCPASNPIYSGFFLNPYEDAIYGNDLILKSSISSNTDSLTKLILSSGSNYNENSRIRVRNNCKIIAENRSKIVLGDYSQIILERLENQTTQINSKLLLENNSNLVFGINSEINVNAYGELINEGGLIAYSQNSNAKIIIQSNGLYEIKPNVTNIHTVTNGGRILLQGGHLKIGDNSNLIFDGSTSFMQVDAGSSIILGENAKIEFKNGAYLIANGSVISSLNPSTPGKGFVFENAGEQTSITWCTFTNLKKPVYIENTTPEYAGKTKVISNNIFNNTGIFENYVIHTVNANNITISNNQILMKPLNGIGLLMYYSLINEEEESSSESNINIHHNNIQSGQASVAIVGMTSYFPIVNFFNNTCSGTVGKTSLYTRQTSMDIRSNSFNFGSSIALELNQATPHVFENNISTAGLSILNCNSYPNLAPIYNADDDSWIWYGGNNTVTSTGNGNINYEKGSVRLDWGQNCFTKIEGYYHLFGQIDEPSQLYFVRNNGFNGSNSPDADLIEISSGAAINPYYYGSSFSCIGSTDGGTVWRIRDLGNGIFDTLYQTNYNAGEQPTQDEILYSEAVLKMENDEYSNAIFVFKSLINGFTNSTHSENSLYNLYKCYQSLDTGNNNGYTIALYTELLNFLSDRILSNLYSEEFNNTAYNIMMMCYTSIENYSEAMEGYEFISLYHPDEHTRILASWDYSEVQAFVNGSGGISGKEENLTEEQYYNLLSKRVNRNVKEDPIKRAVKKSFNKEKNDKISRTEKDVFKMTNDINLAKKEVEKIKLDENRINNRVTSVLRYSNTITREEREKRKIEDLLSLNINGQQTTHKTETALPDNYQLSQNYPNPFNPNTKINFALPKQGFVNLKIYDITGREIQTLVNEVKQAGYYTVDFNGSNLSSGVYFYRIQSGDFVQTKRMVILK